MRKDVEFNVYEDSAGALYLLKYSRGLALYLGVYDHRDDLALLHDLIVDDGHEYCDDCLEDDEFLEYNNINPEDLFSIFRYFETSRIVANEVSMYPDSMGEGAKDEFGGSSLPLWLAYYSLRQVVELPY